MAELRAGRRKERGRTPWRSLLLWEREKIPAAGQVRQEGGLQVRMEEDTGEAGWRCVAPWMGEISPARGEEGRD
jgi:hypothetical protein